VHILYTAAANHLQAYIQVQGKYKRSVWGLSWGNDKFCV